MKSMEHQNLAFLKSVLQILKFLLLRLCFFLSLKCLLHYDNLHSSLKIFPSLLILIKPSGIIFHKVKSSCLAWGIWNQNRMIIGVYPSHIWTQNGYIGFNGNHYHTLRTLNKFFEFHGLFTLSAGLVSYMRVKY